MKKQKLVFSLVSSSIPLTGLALEGTRRAPCLDWLVLAVGRDLIDIYLAVWFPVVPAVLISGLYENEFLINLVLIFYTST